MLILFLIHALVFYAGKYPTNQLISHRVNYRKAPLTHNELSPRMAGDQLISCVSIEIRGFGYIRK